MTDDELAAAFGELRTLCTSIIGFHDLAERQQCTAANLAMYEAQVYAGGIALAQRVFQLADELQQRGGP